ncbi:unnamed protein product [Periconia digitata]|uniref:Uncharacterized protein n=1 Tax=Periconia digitata TaxID=1303443 RepID=A0A9W4XTM3_9PLEO|nr:unnamed protein product [Periconia digitata]
MQFPTTVIVSLLITVAASAPIASNSALLSPLSISAPAPLKHESASPAVNVTPQ